jgi:hypothetical protein
LVELKIAALQDGELSAGAPGGAVLSVDALPYSLGELAA